MMGSSPMRITLCRRVHRHMQMYFMAKQFLHPYHFAINEAAAQEIMEVYNYELVDGEI